MPASKSGETCDSTGLPIMAGDLIRTFHFTGPRRRHFYLYHIACEREEGYIELVPASRLNPTTKPDGGCFWLSRDTYEGEVIDGPGFIDRSIEHRNKLRVEKRK